MLGRKFQFTSALIVTTFLWISGDLAQAKNRIPQQASRTKQETSIHYSQSAPESVSDGSQKWSLGLSTISIPGYSIGSLTGIMKLDHDNMIQGFFVVPTTDPFNFGIRGIFKHTLVRHSHSGFHIGGGLGLASLKANSASDAVMGVNIGFVGGFHFELPNLPEVLVHLDGGANLSIMGSTRISPSSNSLQIGSLSPALGISILYAL